MDDIIKVDNQITVEPVTSLDNELEKINKELFVANAAREFAMFRMYRIYRDKLYIGRYKTFTDFCEEMNELYEVSRPTIYGRIKSYSSLEWMGYSPEDAIRLMIERPFVISQITNSLVHITPDKEIEIKIPVEEEKTPQDAVRNVIEQTAQMTLQDASLYIKENYTFEPTIKLIVDGNKIIIEYTEFAPNVAGDSEIVNYGKVTFFPDSVYPEYVDSYVKKLVRPI